MSKNGQTQAWLKEALLGDQLALTKLLASYHPVLRARVNARMDRALRATTEPEDILQQVYLDVFRRIDRFEDRGRGSFLNWVLTILDNRLIDVGRALRRQMRDVAREQGPRTVDGTQSYWNLLDQLSTDSATPSRVARYDEAVGALLVCLTGLSDLHRQVIRLRFLEGRSVGEVASRLEKSNAAVIALTRRALDALRKSMDRLGEFTGGA